MLSGLCQSLSTVMSGLHLQVSLQEHILSVKSIEVSLVMIRSYYIFQQLSIFMDSGFLFFFSFGFTYQLLNEIYFVAFSPYILESGAVAGC